MKYPILHPITKEKIALLLPPCINRVIPLLVARARRYNGCGHPVSRREGTLNGTSISLSEFASPA